CAYLRVMSTRRYGLPTCSTSVKRCFADIPRQQRNLAVEKIRMKPCSFLWSKSAEPLFNHTLRDRPPFLVTPVIRVDDELVAVDSDVVDTHDFLPPSVLRGPSR